MVDPVASLGKSCSLDRPEPFGAIKTKYEAAFKMGLFDGKTVLVTGGTGSWGKFFVKQLLASTQVKRLIIFSRDEYKQFKMAQEYPGDLRLRFFIGDVRDKDRLYRAFSGVDYIVHAAALKQVPAAEYNPFEAVKTNIHGAQNVIDAAIDTGVKKVIALSTDKACCPVNLYGATKLVSDKLFVHGNTYAGGHSTVFAVVRYGNVVGSRGSVIPFFKKIASCGELPVTDPKMTRFWITLSQSVAMVIKAFELMGGGEIFVPKIPSMKILDLAKAVAPDAKIKFVGIRPGEKLHEELINHNDARRTIDMGDCYVIQPETDWWENRNKHQGQPVDEDFRYGSENNSRWLTLDQLRVMIQDV